jgi:hypothetical protein
MATIQRINQPNVSETITNLVRNWLANEDDPPPGISLFGRCGRIGPCAAALNAEDLSKAADVLHAWFADHLGRPSGDDFPIALLIRSLACASLSLVDWHELADEIWD